ncbi:hypothetical protein PAB09_10960 [Corynebacterium sp. SCR221107]|uniref:hypothetical protein n=1 Tax=Corynebacterium sp. SCR221107 TaxID=3017361 RepID=UPI0022EC2E84|nr:hypothetical protein [Corynebacterium sp. SCR221107]WBT08379.1 hypothetical protein PAB09_10960 [Corynebacterium sp. SCR221107]
MDRREESRQGQRSGAHQRSPRRDGASTGARHRQSDVRAQGGRLPQVYYQRRRAAAVIALVIIVLLVAWALSAIGGSSEESASPVASTATSSKAVSPSTSASLTPTAEPGSDSDSGGVPAAPAASDESAAARSDEETPTSTALAANLPVCDINALLMTASTDHPTYAAGALPVFYMGLKNTSPVDCVVNVDENPLRFEVYDLATNQRMWSDVDCNTAVKTGQQELKAGEEIYFQAKWSRTSSAPEKCTQRETVPAADYYLHTVIGNNASEPATFNLK